MVGTIVGLLAAGHTETEILRAYPYLEPADLRESLAYARVLPLKEGPADPSGPP